MPSFDTTSQQYERTSRTIGSHLNLRTIEWMIKDIMKLGAKNAVEVEILNNVNTNSMSAKTAAKEIKDDNFLSSGGYSGKPLTQSTLAVCHKISFSSFDTALVTLMNYEIDTTKTTTEKDKAWSYFETLFSVLYPPHGYTSTIATDMGIFRKLVSSNQNLACNKAHEVLLEFDGSGDNLYFGFQETNASVSYRADMHYDINSALTSTGVAVTTPRGPVLLDSLNDLEQYLGLNKSKQHISLEYAGTLKIKWVMTSGLDQKGWVET